MKIKNISTNVIFDLPKKEVDLLLEENPDAYELVVKRKPKSQKSSRKQLTIFDDKTILPLILEEKC